MDRLRPVQPTLPARKKKGWVIASSGLRSPATRTELHRPLILLPALYAKMYRPSRSSRRRSQSWRLRQSHPRRRWRRWLRVHHRSRRNPRHASPQHRLSNDQIQRQKHNTHQGRPNPPSHRVHPTLFRVCIDPEPDCRGNQIPKYLISRVSQASLPQCRLFSTSITASAVMTPYFTTAP
jgi:hypothetical protein